MVILNIKDERPKENPGNPLDTCSTRIELCLLMYRGHFAQLREMKKKNIECCRARYVCDRMVKLVPVKY